MVTRIPKERDAIPATQAEIAAIANKWNMKVPFWMLQRAYSAAEIDKLMEFQQVKVDPNAIVPEHQWVDKTVEEWDLAVFKRAAYFNVVWGRTPYGRVVVPCPTFPEALQLAGRALDGAMIYAITPTERYTMLVRARWREFLEVWNAENPDRPWNVTADRKATPSSRKRKSKRA